ncbi:hypothetical protein GSB9_02832 [Flavobacteriaceae bacterium GSB9]|nr:hypothetical protein GSB9_02832 [Flavobacteriaceae bacterium GSB9]
MKTIKKLIRLIAKFFALVVLLQSCTVYKSANSTLEHAFKSKSKVKVTTTNNDSYRFKRIDFEQGKFYGVQKVKGELKYITLDEGSVLSVNEENRAVSSISTFGVFIGSILGIIVTAFYLDTGGSL